MKDPDSELPRLNRHSQRWRHDLGRIRQDAILEIALLVEGDSELTSEWMAKRPSSVRRIFCTPGKDRPTQAPVILHLLQMVGYPDVSKFRDDFENGFDMIGEVRRGPVGRNGTTTATATPSPWTSCDRPTWSTSGAGHHGAGPRHTPTSCWMSS